MPNENDVKPLVGLSKKAYEIAKKVDEERKEKGLVSSITSVVSEAIVTVFGNA